MKLKQKFYKVNKLQLNYNEDITFFFQMENLNPELQIEMQNKLKQVGTNSFKTNNTLLRNFASSAGYKKINFFIQGSTWCALSNNSQKGVTLTMLDTILKNSINVCLKMQNYICYANVVSSNSIKEHSNAFFVAKKIKIKNFVRVLGNSSISKM